MFASYLKQFWRSIGRRATKCFEMFIGADDLCGETKVSKFNDVMAGEEHILGLDVTVDEFVLVLEGKSMGSSTNG